MCVFFNKASLAKIHNKSKLQNILHSLQTNSTMVNHILQVIHPNTKDFDTAEAVDQCYHWILNQFTPLNCYRPKGLSHRRTQCTCMRFLQEQENTGKAMQVAEYMVHFTSLGREAKRSLLHEWAKVSTYLRSLDNTNRKMSYLLPGIRSVQGEAIHRICRNGLQGLLDVGRRSWKTAMEDPGRAEQLTGRMELESNKGKANAEIYDSLHIFFTELKLEALPFATRIIRDETGTTTRDDDPDDLVLPPHISKHSCFARWCYLRGWKVEKKSSAKTIYTPVKEFTRRPFDDDDEDGVPLWPEGSEYKRVVTWPTFLYYWKRKFPHIKVRKKGADTCTDCQILCNEFRTRQARSERIRAAEGRDDANDDTDSGAEDPPEEEDPPGEDLENEIVRMEGTLEKARQHVRAYQVQRDQSRRLISLARLYITHLLPSLVRRKVLTIDMGQNLCLPNFEAEQPGDTYYMSPLTVLLFGVVDNATEDGKDRMNAYIWREFEGDRGANNIASCLLKDLKRRGWLQGPNFSELTYIADNCGGQNKNKVVVRFLMWLVENRIFPRVRIFFLVKGHTKNAADRMFNLLKHQYHRRNIFTYEKLHETLSMNAYVDVFQMRPEHFYDHLEWQDKYYRTPTQGEFKRTHVFTICRNTHGITAHIRNAESKPTQLLKQDDNDSIIRIDDLMPTNKSRKARRLNPEVRAQEIARMEQELKQLNPTPLKPIKQVELWKKWGPLLPEGAREETCPRPSDDVIKSIKDRNSEKGRLKAKQKKLQNATKSSDNNFENSGKDVNES